MSDDISVGNLSGKEGDLSPLYKRILEIVEAVSKHEAEKSAGSQLKLHLNNLEEDILDGMGSGKRKLLCGDIVDNTKRKHTKTPSFEENLLMMVAGPREPTEKIMHAEEEQFEVVFLEWIAGNDKILNNLLACAEVNVIHASAVEDIGLKTLVSIYCTPFGTDLQGRSTCYGCICH